MLLMGLFVLLLVATVALIYVFWIRPMLSQRPSFRDFYDREDSFWSACRAWTSGLKQKLTTVTVVGGGSVVSLYDFTAPLVSQAGVDVTKLTDRVPSWCWPLLTMALLGLVQYFRNLNDAKVAVDRNVERIMETKDEPAS